MTKEVLGNLTFKIESLIDHKTNKHTHMENIHYPLGDTLPEIGKLEKVQEGVFWLRMPLPFALDHINLWLLRDCFEGKEGWTIVDCGITSDITKQAWETIFANCLEGLPIVRVLVTHMHPDHVGLAHWLCEKWQVPLWMSMTDFLMAKWLSSKEGGQNIGSVSGGGGSADHFYKHGLTDENDLEKIRARADHYSNLVPNVPQRFRRVMDQDKVKIGNREWLAISGHGHSPEHLSFACVEDTLVLPSHGKPFIGLHHRISQLREHHDARLKETLDACKEPTTAKNILPILFHRKLDIHQMTFAMGEAIAHLNYLWRRGLIKRQIDSNGILWFSQ